MRLFYFVLLFLLLAPTFAGAQAISINTDASNPDPSAILDVKSTDKGVLVPRMTTAQRTAIAAPATGLLVFDTDTKSFWFYAAGAWTNLSGGSPTSLIADTDGNTRVQTEESPNEDIIRFDLAGAERLVLRQNAGGTPRLELFSPNFNTAIGENALLSNTTALNNTAFGYNALRFTTTGGNNTAIGFQALYANSTGAYNTATGMYSLRSNSAGSQNTANGREALFSNTGGGSNTANGAFALYSNTNGGNNTAGGMTALYSNTTGGNNTASGTSALYSNTTGSFNTAHGVQALYSNTTGFANVAIGKDALYRNTDRAYLVAVGDSALYNNGVGATLATLAIGNTALGSKALFANTTGAENTSTGDHALFSNTTGLRNTANGRNALYTNITGKYNTATGATALYSNTGGDFNTATGTDALNLNTTGSSNTANGVQALVANTTGSNNTALGFSADVSSGNLTNATAVGAHAFAGASNSLVLGSIAGVNGATNSVNVGIGTTTPAEKLDVAGAIKIGNTSTPAPAAGTIRWNDTTQDFEGYTGTKWVSLTNRVDSWGITTPTILESQSALASDGAAYDLFGSGVAVSGDYAVVGARNKNLPGNSGPGKAYIFIRSGATWSQQAILTASDGVVGDEFGSDVAISGDYAVIGAFRHAIGGNVDQGQAYVFVRSGATWSQQAILTASDGAANHRFGSSVAISGDYAIVGAYQHEKAYVFVRSGATWPQQAILIASDGVAGDDFGGSVAISGNYAIVGAGGHNASQGQAYIFIRSGATWSQQAILAASDGAAGDYFGSVAISGDYAIVGAAGHYIGGNIYQGESYVFFRSGATWSQQAILTASDGVAVDYFGGSVAIYGDYAIVGAICFNGNNNYNGKAYVFARAATTWSQQAILTASDGTQFNSFGGRVAISGNYVVVGAEYQGNPPLSEQGKVYFFAK